MQKYNLKNLSGKKIAIDCNSWEMGKSVTYILNQAYPEIGFKNEWLETTPFHAIVYGDGVTSYAQFTHLGWETHYWVKEKGLTIIPGEEFISDNSLEPVGVSSVRQQDSIISEGEEFANFLDRHRNDDSIIWLGLLSWTGTDAVLKLYNMFREHRQKK